MNADVNVTPNPLWGSRAGVLERTILFAVVVVPFASLFVAIGLLWGHGIGWLDLAQMITMYVVTAHGVTIGYHRLFTHRSFRAARPLRIILAVLGTCAFEGDVFTWAADHRRHHQFSDRAGDPHSPWRFGTSVPAVLKGMVWAHMGWMFFNERTDQRHYVPDLLTDPDLVRVARWQPTILAVSLAVPAAIGGAVTSSWAAVGTALFWVGLVRIAVLHHVTWSINSICHAFGATPYRSHDRSGNVWWLALPSGGEAWHNYHHADPSSARHGVLRWQFDTSARLIWVCERLGWAHSVRWPSLRRIDSKRKPRSLDGNSPDPVDR